MNENLKIGLGLLVTSATEPENLKSAADVCWDSVLTAKISVTEFIDTMIEIEKKIGPLEK